MHFNSSSSTFEASFIVDPSIREPTILYWSPDYYPRGFDLSIVKDGVELKEKEDYSADFKEKYYAKILLVNPSLKGAVLRLKISSKDTSVRVT